LRGRENAPVPAFVARSSERLDVLLAAEAVLPCPGGAERFAMELLAALAERHRVRALIVGEPDLVAPMAAHAPSVEVIDASPRANEAVGAWGRRRQSSEQMRELVRELAARDPADIVLGQLNAGAGALAGARDAKVAGVMLLAGYEALCHYAFAPGTHCRPASRCTRCPRALALPEREHRDLLWMRAAQDAALASAAGLVAPSRAMSVACERVSGRRPLVAAPVASRPPPAAGRPDGRVVFVSSVWTEAKGVSLLAPIARRLPRRSVMVRAPNGLPEEHRAALVALPNVTVCEEGSGIDGALADAAMLLVPSQHAEPFGRVAFEAMAAGVPTLASATGGLAEYVPAAQLVRALDDAGAWANAVRALEHRSAWDDARRRGMAAAARVLAADSPGRIERWLGAWRAV
jgi:glycosyltransferase involved in cell wall biosynthesis